MPSNDFFNHVKSRDLSSHIDRWHGKMRINLLFPNGVAPPMSVDVAPDEPIASILARIMGEVELTPQVEHTLELNGMALSELSSLGSYNIASGETFSVVAIRQPSMQVFVKTATGHTIVLDVERDDTVAAVKRKIQEQERIPVELQRLIFVGEQLDDRRRFLDYHVEYESAVHLVFSTADSFPLCVDLPRGTVILQVHPVDTVASIKRSIQEREGVAFDVQRLSFEGRELRDEDALAVCGITRTNNVIRVSIDEDRNTQIFVSIPGQERISLWVNTALTVARIKELIEARQGIPADTQRLCFARRLLDDDRTLAACGIEDNHMIHLSIVDPQPINLTVRKQNGSVLNLMVPSDERVGELKVRIAAIERATPMDLQLFHNGTYLEDSSKLCNVPHLADGSTINLIVPLEAAFPDTSASAHGGRLLVFVRSLAGKVMPVQLQSVDTVGELKRRVEVQEGIPRANQCLVTGGCQLQDDRTIGEYGVQNQSTVHLVVRVPRPLNLHVRTLDGNRVQLTCDPTRTVRSLLEGVGTQDVEHVSVFLGEQELQLEHSLGFYQIAEGSVLQLQAKDSG